MLCMADVHEVQEANDKSKFHRQIKNVLECMFEMSEDKTPIFAQQVTTSQERCERDKMYD